jgi:D-arabinose 1-dehydrogenase-like Zn-dependent alcohol dehydrogenase
MRAMVVTAPKKPLALEQRPIPEPKRGEVRIRVHACGVCHSDHFVTEGLSGKARFRAVLEMGAH